MIQGVERGARLATGRTAEIFAWGDGQVLKLLYAWCAPGDAAQEATIARAVHAAGLPVPAVIDLVTVEGRPGIIFERVGGPSLLQAITAQPRRLFTYARLLADLHATLHTCMIPELPAQRPRLATAIGDAPGLSVPLKEAAWTVLNRRPRAEALCHGDFHPANVILAPRGPIVLDWIDATAGHPLADVARTSLLLRLSPLPPETARRTAIRLLRQVFHAVYLRRYLARQPGTRREVTAWQVPVAAARLTERVPGEERALTQIVTAALPECRLCGH
jgi:aminoglycoside phosphotransferase (APT) family kinase protein